VKTGKYREGDVNDVKPDQIFKSVVEAVEWLSTNILDG